MDLFFKDTAVFVTSHDTTAVQCKYRLQREGQCVSSQYLWRRVKCSAQNDWTGQRGSALFEMCLLKVTPHFATCQPQNNLVLHTDLKCNTTACIKI